MIHRGGRCNIGDWNLRNSATGKILFTIHRKNETDTRQVTARKGVVAEFTSVRDRCIQCCRVLAIVIYYKLRGCACFGSVRY